MNFFRVCYVTKLLSLHTYQLWVNFLPIEYVEWDLNINPTGNIHGFVCLINVCFLAPWEMNKLSCHQKNSGS